MDVALVGGTGMVGKLCLKHLAALPEVTKIYSVSRRPLPEEIAKVEQRVGSLESFDTPLSGLRIDAAVCCLGTTIREAGSREAFEEIDLNLPLYFAKAAQKAGASTFHVISALGANATSSTFYLRVKGVLENELKTLGFRGLHIYRPSLLLGDREEFRLGERLAQMIYEKVDRFYPPILDRYKPIPADRLASFIAQKVKAAEPGIHVCENSVIHQAFAGS